MKKILYTLVGACLVASSVNGQVTNSSIIKVTEGAIVTFSDDIVNSGTIVNEGDILINKNIENSGDIQSIGNVSFAGDDLQKVSGSKLINLSKATIENDILLENPLVISDELTFNRGIIESSVTAPLVFAKNASHFGASDLSHIKGMVIKENATNFEFPIGNGNTYRGYDVKSNTPQILSTEYKEANPLSISKDVSKYVESINKNEYWILKSESENGDTEIGLDAGYGDNQVTYLRNGIWKVAENQHIANRYGLKEGIAFTSGRGKMIQTSLGIWPNPTQKEFNLKLSGIEDDVQATVEVINQSGIVLLRNSGKVKDLRKVYSLPGSIPTSELTVRLTPINEEPLVDKLIISK